MFQNYNIRAELPNNEMVDFKVGAETLQEAREVAEQRLLDLCHFPERPRIEWRGLVAFVGRMP